MIRSTSYVAMWASLALFPNVVSAQAVWTLLSPANMPMARTGAAYASDATSFYVFGGGDNVVGQVADTWRFDGNDWTDVTSGFSPPARYRHAMAYNFSTAKVVMFGGSTANQLSTSLNDTWEFDPATQLWTELFPATVPSARRWHSMAYDPINGTVLMFGGQDANGRLNETWSWNGSDWTLLSPATVPGIRERAAMTTMITAGEILMFGGNPGGGSELGDTWRWNGVDWVQVLTATIPYGTGTRNAGMAYDVSRDRIVLAGGVTGGVFRNNTWEFDGVDWIDRGASPMTARTFPAIAYSIGLGKTFLFSGFGGVGTYFAETWEYQTDSVASFTRFGSGCMGANAVPQLTVQGLPWLGESFTFAATPSAPTAASLVAFGISNTLFNGLPLPFDLGFFGSPGCSLLIGPLTLLPSAGPIALPLPTDPALAGLSVYLQALSVEVSGGLFTSEGVAVNFGLL